MVAQGGAAAEARRGSRRVVRKRVNRWEQRRWKVGGGGKGGGLGGGEGPSVKSCRFSHTDYSPLRGFQALADTVLESSASALSNAVSTIIWELRSGEWTACKSELDSSGLRGRVISLAETSSFFYAGHPPLRGFQAGVGTALESLVSALSNAVPTTLMQRWKALPPLCPTLYQRLSGSHATMGGWRVRVS